MTHSQILSFVNPQSNPARSTHNPVHTSPAWRWNERVIRLWISMHASWLHRCTVNRLTNLSDHLLSDIGIDRSEIQPFARSLTDTYKSTRLEAWRERMGKGYGKDCGKGYGKGQAVSFAATGSQHVKKTHCKPGTVN